MDKEKKWQEDSPKTEKSWTEEDSPKKNKTWIYVLVAVLVVAIILAFTTCGKNKPAEEPVKAVSTAAPATPAPTKAPAPTEAPKAEEPAPSYAAALEEIKALINSGKYYEAAQAIVACRESWPESAAECDALWQQIKEALADKRPETGEMERTFLYQGGNIVKITSDEGDIDLTITSRSGHGYARYYVREGESVEFYVPCYGFDVDYTKGDIWFDDEIGFGEFGEPGSYEEGLRFVYTEVPCWVIFHFAEGNPEVQNFGDRIVPGLS